MPGGSVSGRQGLQGVNPGQPRLPLPSPAPSSLSDEITRLLLVSSVPRRHPCALLPMHTLTEPKYTNPWLPKSSPVFSVIPHDGAHAA